MPQRPLSGVIRFGAFEVEPQAGILRKGDARIPLQEQPFLKLDTVFERKALQEFSPQQLYGLFKESDVLPARLQPFQHQGGKFRCIYPRAGIGVELYALPRRLEQRRECFGVNQSGTKVSQGVPQVGARCTFGPSRPQHFGQRFSAVDAVLFGCDEG